MQTESAWSDGPTTRRRFLRYVGAAGAVGASALAGCSGNGDTTTTSDGGDGGGGGGDETTTTSAGSDRSGGTLIVGSQADMGNFDPHKAQAAISLNILNNVYQKLTIIDEELKPVGQLAESWEVSDDGLTWRFSLREGVQFHPPESRELVAADVVYSFERVMAEETGSPWRSNFTPITNVSADGDYTVVFELEQPYAPFLYKLTSGGFVLPEGAAESSEYDISEQPVGSGPFVFAEYVSQTRTVLERFDDYWETDEDGTQLPYLDAVEFRPIPEGQSRITSLQTGEIDFAMVIPASQASTLEGQSGIVFSNIPGTFYDYIGQNTTNAPLDDVRLRQAISWAVDRESIVQGARFGYATPTQDPVPPSSVWKDLITVEEPYSQDQERARQLIEESSYDGEELTIQVGQEYGEQVSIAEIVQEQLSDVGLNVTIQQLEFSSMIENLNAGDYYLTIVGWVGFVDPDDMLYLQFHSGETFNQSNYSNEEVDELLELGRTATGSREERAQYYDDAVDIIAREAPYTFLEFNEEIAAWREAVTNFTHISTSTPRFTDVWLDE